MTDQPWTDDDEAVVTAAIGDASGYAQDGFERWAPYVLQALADAGWRPPSADPVYADVIVPCRDTREDLDGALCTGEFRYGPHDIQAKCTACGGWRGRWAPSDMTAYDAGVAAERARLEAQMDALSRGAYVHGLGDGKRQGRLQAAADLDALAGRLDDECAAHGVASAHSNGMRNAADVLTGESWLLKKENANNDR